MNTNQVNTTEEHVDDLFERVFSQNSDLLSEIQKIEVNQIVSEENHNKDSQDTTMPFKVKK